MQKSAEELWSQARADFSTASLLREASAYYAAVFFSQQAAEKSLKALSIEAFDHTARGHNLIAIADAMHAPLEVMNCAAELNADFLAALYPEACGGVPCQQYDHAAATRHLDCADRIMRWSIDTVYARSPLEDRLRDD